MTTHLGLQRILLPTAQVSSLTTGSITLPSRGLLAVPDAPTIGTATAGAGSASVTFTAAATGTTATSFIVTSSPDGITGTGSSSPITVSGLTNGTAYTFTVAGINASGTGAQSAPSNSATPAVVGNWYSIASYTAGSDTGAAITFSNISQSYKHLVIVCGIGSTYGGSGGGDGGRFWINDDTSSVYKSSYLYGNGSTTGTSSEIGNWFASFGGLWSGNNNKYAQYVYMLYDYTDTNKQKSMTNLIGSTLLLNGNGTNSSTNSQVGVYKSQSAITRLDFRMSTAIGSDGNIRAGSKISLFGIGV